MAQIIERGADLEFPDPNQDQYPTMKSEEYTKIQWGLQAVGLGVLGTLGAMKEFSQVLREDNGDLGTKMSGPEVAKESLRRGYSNANAFISEHPRIGEAIGAVGWLAIALIAGKEFADWFNPTPLGGSTP